MIREPAVAGRFYPKDPNALRSVIHGLIDETQPRMRMIGAVIPHAGYMYSGAVAGAVYSRLEVPSSCVVLCPNHTGFGPPLSIMASGSWRTPFGKVAIDEDLCAALLRADFDLTDDTQAHRLEHAIEVHLPFLQHLAGPAVRFAPIAVGTGRWRHLEELGSAMAEVIQRDAPETLIIASSDMNHYESDEITRIKDRKAIEPILRLDAAELVEVTQKEDISMCGYGPAAAMLVAARKLGATVAELVQYATSADVSGDYDRVVGYAGLTVR